MTTVLQVLPALVTGGVERGTVEVTAALVAGGHRALVASSGGPMVEEIVKAGGEHFIFPLASKNPAIIYANGLRLTALIKEQTVDIVHARSRAPAWSALLAARQTGAHFVTTFHNAYGANSWLKRRYNAVMAKGERVIAISNFVAEHVRQTYHVLPEKLRVIPRGVDISVFDPEKIAPERITALRKQWQLDATRPVLLLPGRISPWKGHAVLLAALARLDRPELQAVFVGGGDAESEGELDHLIARHNLTGSARRVATCRDMPAAYLLADIVVSPATRPEGFGRVIVEAQAMGRPVIATNHGGACETIIDGTTGWLVPPGDTVALAETIAQILSSDAAAKAVLAARAIAHIRAHFTTAQMTGATLKVYDEIMAAKSR